MERGEFNDLMKDAFKDAETTPSENVWTNIELELEKEEGGIIRRRLFYYKMVAAASVVFALSVGATAVFILNKPATSGEQQALLKGLPNKESNQNQEQQLREGNSTQSVERKEIEESKTGIEGKTGLTQKSSTKSTSESDASSESVRRAKSSAGTALTKVKTAAPANFNSLHVASSPSENNGYQKGNQENSYQRTIDDRTITSASGPIQTSWISRLSKTLRPTFIKSTEVEVVPDAGALLLAKLAAQEQAMQAEDKKKEKRSERLWTSVGFAAGGFSAVNSSVSPAMMNTTSSTAFSQNVSVANQQSKASGSTYSVGINVGKKIAERWVLQGGFNYLTQASDYTANTAFTSPDYQSFKVASYAPLSDAANARVVSTASYQVNNTLQFVSMPLQAGYIVVNQKVIVQLNSGVSTDLFLQNTLTPQDGTLDKTTQSNGSESPYRTINFSGLVGTEISYKFGQHYRLALNPGLRYPFSSIYKSDVGVSASPLTFDVGLRFRYIFH